MQWTSGAFNLGTKRYIDDPRVAEAQRQAELALRAEQAAAQMAQDSDRERLAMDQQKMQQQARQFAQKMELDQRKQQATEDYQAGEGDRIAQLRRIDQEEKFAAEERKNARADELYNRKRADEKADEDQAKEARNKEIVVELEAELEAAISALALTKDTDGSTTAHEAAVHGLLEKIKLVAPELYSKYDSLREGALRYGTKPIPIVPPPSSRTDERIEPRPGAYGPQPGAAESGAYGAEKGFDYGQFWGLPGGLNSPEPDYRSEGGGEPFNFGKGAPGAGDSSSLQRQSAERDAMLQRAAEQETQRLLKQIEELKRRNAQQDGGQSFLDRVQPGLLPVSPSGPNSIPQQRIANAAPPRPEPGMLGMLYDAVMTNGPESFLSPVKTARLNSGPGHLYGG
jgi:hypothetical protein